KTERKPRPMPTLEQFADNRRLRIRRDSCGEAIIAGKPRNASRPEYQSHIYDNGDERFGVCLLCPTVGKWNNAAKRLLAIGLELVQNGDTEGTLLFTPDDRKKAKAAIREAGIKTRRTM